MLFNMFIMRNNSSVDPCFVPFFSFFYKNKRNMKSRIHRRNAGKWISRLESQSQLDLMKNDMKFFCLFKESFYGNNYYFLFPNSSTE